MKTFNLLLGMVLGLIVGASAMKAIIDPSPGQEAVQTIQSFEPHQTAPLPEMILPADALHILYEESDGTAVMGVITNITALAWERLEITYDTYDLNSARIGSARARLDHLNGGEAWHFRAPYFSTEVKKIRLAQIQAMASK